MWGRFLKLQQKYFFAVCFSPSDAAQGHRITNGLAIGASDVLIQTVLVRV